MWSHSWERPYIQTLALASMRGFWADWKLSLSLSAVYVEIEQGQVPGMPVSRSHEGQPILRTRTQDVTGVGPGAKLGTLSLIAMSNREVYGR
jgi:hypothetical protein